MTGRETLYRPALPADATQCADVLRRSIVELCVADHGGDATVIAGWTANKTPDFVLKLIETPEVLLRVAEREGVVVGVGAASVSGEITLNYVAPEARYSGVSGGMIRHLEAGLHALGCHTVRLTSTRTAYDFYRRHGYGDDGEPVDWRGSLSFPMKKHLPPQAKVCPVVLRERAGETEILVFEHPLAGVQLVKGTLEPGEAPETAALRELAEEAGLVDARVTRVLGESEGIAPGQVWTFARVEAGELPDAWVFHTLDDGGHDFSFFWHPIDAPPDARWHPVFIAALEWVRAAYLT